MPSTVFLARFPTRFPRKTSRESRQTRKQSTKKKKKKKSGNKVHHRHAILCGGHRKVNGDGDENN